MMRRRAVVLGAVAGLALLLIGETIVAWLASTVVVKTAAACHKPIARGMVHLQLPKSDRVP